MRKDLLYILTLTALAFQACSKDIPEVEFGLDTDKIEIGPDGGTMNVKVSVAGRWSAELTEPWVLVSPASGVGETVCNVRIDSTLLNDERSLKVRFNDRDGKQSQLLSIVQAGYPKQVTVSQTEVELENFAAPSLRHFDVDVTSNVPYTVKIAQNEDRWLKSDVATFTPNGKARPRTRRIRFIWDGNSSEEVRLADITFETEESLDVQEAVKVTQKRAPEITDDRKGDSLAIVIIEQKLNVWVSFNHDEPMDYWNGVTLWKASDKECKNEPERIGRVRSLQITMFTTPASEDAKGYPAEFAKLRYLERLSLFSNGNKFRRHITKLGGITELTGLKYLQLSSAGLTDLPDEFANLENLEVLDLSSNIFSRIPDVLSPDNFPKLTQLNLATCERQDYGNLTVLTVDKEERGGFYMDYAEGRNTLKKLFSWSKLKRLILSNNLFMGQIPDMLDFSEKYTEEDIIAAGDTLKNATYNLVGKPKVLPNCYDFRIGLNYLTGNVPDWILYHPKLMFWNPDISVFNQENQPGEDGRHPGFGNVPASYDYYWTAYPFWAERMSGN
ncbi:MAG: hypothetical protein ACI3ZS_00500 [Candidatus Cryptobacteroides sp.]